MSSRIESAAVLSLCSLLITLYRCCGREYNRRAIRLWRVICFIGAQKERNPAHPNREIISMDINRYA